MMSPELREKLKGPALGLGLLVLLALAFSAGRFSAPEQVREVERWKVREVERWKTLDLTTEDVTRGMTFARTIDRWRKVTTTPTPAGPVVVEESGEHESSTSSSTEFVNRTETHDADRTETHDLDRTTEKTTTLRPDWRLGALVGGRFAGGPVGLVAGGIVERRVVGGVSVAGWGILEVDTKGPTPAVTGGQVGLGVLAEF